MNLMSVTPMPEQRVAQLIDANLDRAREGLRVVEDWCRFGLHREDLVITLKNWRQELGQHHLPRYKQARSTQSDFGIGLKHPYQEKRTFPHQVVEANCARAQEALRVLEEFARQPDPKLAESASNIRYGLYELELTIINATNGTERRKKLKDCHVCLITETQTDLIDTITASLEAGIQMIQYRCKNTNDLKKFDEAQCLASICKRFKALFIVNDRIDIALAVEADGIHLGQDDLPTDIARSLVGPELLIGRSTHSIQQIHKADQEGCDYLGVGPIFPTNTKPELNPKGLSFVHEASRATSTPWFAIGGINSSNLKSLSKEGVKRVAVIGAIMNSKDPALATKEMLKGMS